MRLSLRFIVPLAVTLGLIAVAMVPFVDTLTFRWFTRDVEMRSKLVANTMHDSLVLLIQSGSSVGMQKLFNRAVEDERLYGVAFCDSQGKMRQKTQLFPEVVTCERGPPGPPSFHVLPQRQGALHVSYIPLEEEGRHLGRLILVHDLSFAQRRSADTRWYILYFFLALGSVISALTVFVAQMSLRGWIHGMRDLLRGQRLMKPLRSFSNPELRPIVKDLRSLVRDLESERRTRDESQLSWSPKTLKEILRRDLAGDEVLIVSNREPYIHEMRKGRVEVRFPASGLVTALEPVMRACSGTWIAHGGGSADHETVDRYDRVQVPPTEPSYQLRRVWLTPEEEQGYYYGFANEGIWALCHIAHVRPVFRSEDWEQYVRVNEKFAEAVVQEAKTDDPVVLVQDYHFALLPKMIRERLPRSTVISFWHIPFPNSEVFGICPWRERLLEGMLGSSILGFHTRFHCNNFMDSVDRFLESRIDRDASTVTHGGQLTAVKHYPISIEYPNKWMKTQKSLIDCRASVRQQNDLPRDRLLGIGVDRLDYTKGILELFRAVERLLDRYPEWRGRFTFVQIAAPSRTSIEEYQHFDAKVRELAAKINHRFGRIGYQPILLKVEHHEPEQIYEYYRASELCFVSSLHDGMNLVAKEFVASREDEQGVLVLSQFTGAARELPEALIVNPYDTDQCA